MCSDSSRSWCWAAMVVLVAAGLIAGAGAQPAAGRRAVASAASADNGLRQSHGSASRAGRHSHRNADPVRFLCGTELSNELARVCAGRGYNGHMAYTGTSPRGPRFGGVGGAATSCCDNGCTLKDLDTYCNPGPTSMPRSDESTSPESDSVERVSASTLYDEENTVPSNNEIQREQEDPKKKPNGAKSPKDAEAENELPRQHAEPPHRVVIKTTDFYRHNSPVTQKQLSTIR